MILIFRFTCRFNGLHFIGIEVAKYSNYFFGFLRICPFVIDQRTCIVVRNIGFLVSPFVLLVSLLIKRNFAKRSNMRSISTVRISLLLTGVLLLACTFNPSEEALVFEQNEKVVFLGNAFFENAFESGEIETTFSLSFPDKNITFRNIGWSGDNVYAHARTRARGGGRFGNPDEGFGILNKQITELKPDKIFIAYGPLKGRNLLYQNL